MFINYISVLRTKHHEHPWREKTKGSWANPGSQAHIINHHHQPLTIQPPVNHHKPPSSTIINHQPQQSWLSSRADWSIELLGVNFFKWFQWVEPQWSPGVSSIDHSHPIIPFVLDACKYLKLYLNLLPLFFLNHSMVSTQRTVLYPFPSDDGHGPWVQAIDYPPLLDEFSRTLAAPYGEAHSAGYGKKMMDGRMMENEYEWMAIPCIYKYIAGWVNGDEWWLIVDNSRVGYIIYIYITLVIWCNKDILE